MVGHSWIGQDPGAVLAKILWRWMNFQFAKHLTISAVVIIYSCYCDVRIELASEVGLFTGSVFNFDCLEADIDSNCKPS